MDSLSAVFLGFFFFNFKIYGYIIGIVVSLCYWKKYPEISHSAFIGFTILLVSLAAMVFINSANYVGKIGSFRYFPHEILHAIFGVIGWSCIVYAVFGKRKEQPEYRKEAVVESVDSADRRQHNRNTL